MKKIKNTTFKILLFLVTTTVVFTAPSYSAKVIKILKKSRYIVTDLGSKDNLKKGERVCVFDNLIGKKIACGKVRKVKKNKSYVKVKSLKKIKIGLQVGIAKTGRTLSKKDKSSKKNKILKANYIITPATVATFNNLKYKYPKDANAQSAPTLWESLNSSSTSLVGFGGDFEMPLGKYDLAVGLKYKIYTSAQGKFGSFIFADYGDVSTDYIYISQTASSLSFFGDLLWYSKKYSKNLELKFGNGVDINQSTVLLKGEKKSDLDATASTEIYNVKSSLSTISLRNTLNLYMYFGKFGLGASVNAMIPLVSSASQSISSNDEFSNLLSSGDTQKDTSNALDHKKGSFGLELIFSTFISI